MNFNVTTAINGSGTVSFSFTTSDANARTSFGNETVSEISSPGSVTLNETTVTGNVHAKGNMTATKVKILGAINVSGKATIISSACQHVKSAGSIELQECLNVKSVDAEDQITLISSKVQGDVITKNGAKVNKSSIGGMLLCSSNYLVIEGSEIGTVQLRQIRTLDHSKVISLSNSSAFSNVFNFNVSTIIPENKEASLKSEHEQDQKQVLILRNCKVKNITFEGGKGEVYIEESSVSGNIIGGRIVPKC